MAVPGRRGTPRFSRSSAESGLATAPSPESALAGSGDWLGQLRGTSVDDF